MTLTYPKTLIVRHKRENKKKCSLEPIVGREDCQFISYPGCTLPDLKNYLMLSFDGPVLSEKDQGRGILLIDGTWKLAGVMEAQLFKGMNIETRSLPKAFTAYPRCQLDCPEPGSGLASIEALYLTYLILKRDATKLLDHYYWKEKFLLLNQDLFNLTLSER